MLPFYLTYSRESRTSTVSGYSGSPVVWDHLEGPLRLIDPELLRFASERGLTVCKGEPGWPSRMIEWQKDIDRSIQVFLDGHKKLTYTIWICAKKDHEDRRYFKAKCVMESADIEEIMSDLPGVLTRAYAEVNSWSASDLEFEVRRPVRSA